MSEDAYSQLRIAKGFASGLDPSLQSASGAGRPLISSPLWILILAFTSRLGADSAAVALYASALGWGTVGWVWVLISRRLKRPLSGWLASGMVLISPQITTIFGTEMGWVLAVGWALIGNAVIGRVEAKRPLLFLLGMLLLLLLRFDLATLLLVLVLIITLLRTERRTAALTLVPILLAGGVWGWLNGWAFGRLFTLDWQTSAAFVQSYLQHSELYAVLLAAAVGLWFLWQQHHAKLIIVLTTWHLFSLFSSVPVATFLILLFVFAVFIDGIAAWVAQAKKSSQRRVAAVVLVAPLLLAFGASWLQIYPQRPLHEHQLEREIAAWLAADGQFGATVLASPHLGSLIPHQFRPLGEGALENLRQSRPDYLVTTRQNEPLVHAAWFQETYVPLERFDAPLAGSGYVLWGYQNSAFDLGRRDLLRYTSPAGLDLVGYRLNSPQLDPQSPLEVTLFVEGKRPPSTPFSVQIRLLDASQMAVAESISPWPIESLQAAKITSNTFVISMPQVLAHGSYTLTAAFQPDSAEEPWPFFAPNALDPIASPVLGTVSMPWRGDLAASTAVGVTFGESIQLVAYETKSDWQAGMAAELTLYWQTEALPGQEYFLFVHLFNEMGELVVNHNQRPTSGVFPMQAWHPGGIIRDRQMIAVPADLPAGSYRLNVGLFDIDSGERLPVNGRDGETISDNTLPLRMIEIR